MKKEYLKKYWRKLDNTAKIFSLEGKKNANTFRYSVILKQNIDEKTLEEALKRSLNQYSAFKVKIGTGLFWNYLEFNSKEPIVKKEDQIPCAHIDFKKNNDYLFKITYYKKKINLDVFHVLTDGAGALKFLYSIIYNYLDLKHNISVDENISFDNTSSHDLYLKKYEKKVKKKRKSKKAYLFPEKANRNINNTYHYIIDMNEIKNVCKSYNVTITEYLTATYIYAIYSSIYNKNSNKEIVITVPINLRTYYQVDTLSNFFVCMNINPKILEKNLTTFDDVLDEVHKDFEKKLNKDKIKQYLANDVKLGTNIIIRLIPLFIKKLFIKYAINLFSKSTTSTLSNVGIISVDDKYKQYIDNIVALVMPGRIQKIKCTVCSFDNNLNVTINSNIDDMNFEQTFFKLLQKNIKNIKLESNNHVKFK